MILIGQYDSPFVRRVGIALRLYGIGFEHRPWSVFGDSDKIAPLNPLIRVPTLVLDDGDVISDSHIILDHLDGIAAEGAALFPRLEPARRQALKIATLAVGAGELAVGLFYELRLHDTASATLVARRRRQIEAAIAALEADRAGRMTPWWFGGTFGHADIAAACVWRFISEAHPGLIDSGEHPHLRGHAERMEAMAVFQEIAQPFIPPN